MARRQRIAARRRDTVVIGYIHPGQVSSYFMESMLTTVLGDIAADAQGIHPRRVVNLMQEWSSANVSQARNAVTQRFLDRPEGDWLLWVDADMQWDPDAVEQLLAVADPVARPIVGGLCFGMFRGEMFPTIYQWARLPEGLTTVRVRDYPRGEVMQVAATGAAFLLIHRSALEKVAARQFNAAFPFFQETELNGQPVGEDLTFCIRAGLCDIPVHVHTGVAVGHHKSDLLTETKYLAQQTVPPLDDTVGLVIPTRGDHPDLLRGIITAAGLPPERVVVVDTAGGLDVPGATVVEDLGPLNIHRWWNLGIDTLVERGCSRVAVLNDDLTIDSETLPRLARALGGATLAVAEKAGAGHCWMLDTTAGVRPDEGYRWWCGDLQLWADASNAGGAVTVPNARCQHLHANEATSASPDLLALAEADGALYDSRHPAGSRFARVSN